MPIAEMGPMNADMSPSNNPNFQSTSWSLVVSAGGSKSPEADQALQDLCQAYWFPLYAYARRTGKTTHEAEDSTQAFFEKLLEKNFIESANPNRGRFRSFLLTVFKRFLSDEYTAAGAEKRGGFVRHFSIDFDDGEKRYSLDPVDEWTPEKHFDRQWALTLLQRVLANLRQLYFDRQDGDFFELAQNFLTTNSDETSHSEIAEKLSLSPGAVRVRVHRMRTEYRELLLSEVAQTLNDAAESKSELEYLRSAIRGD